MLKPIKDFQGYFINEKGEVFSSIIYRRYKDKLRKVSTYDAWGYKTVTLQKNRKSNKRFVHRLVLQTFIGECPKGFQCRHLNGDKQDCRLENLKWGSRSENQLDRIKHGTDNRGERHGMAKLTKENVKKIRIMGLKNNKKVRKIDNGGNYKEIAKKFNIAPSTVGHIVRGSTWGWLK